MSHKIKFLFLCIYIVFSQNIFAQNYPTDYFIWPIEKVYRITGSFGAIRNNHFHSGIDISTNKKEGFPVLSSADGYIVRIKVSPYGYGNALYVNHPNSYTTVYAHLKKFSPEIQEFVKDYQYKNKTFDCELFPPRNKFVFKKGEIIAYSGNSGGSTGAHLHFEIRDTKSEEIIDPMLFGFRYIDSIAPLINGRYSIFKLNSLDKMNTGFYPHITQFWKTDLLGNKYDTLYLNPGNYALAYDAEDFYNDKRIGVGINHSILNLNEQKIFEMKIDRFAFDETRMINCHIPYDIYYNTGKRLHKAFKDNGNMLPFYSAGNGNFSVNVNEISTLKLNIYDRYDSSDFATLIIIGNNEVNHSWVSYKNTSTYTDSLIYFPTLPSDKLDSLYYIHLPKFSLYDTLILKYHFNENNYGIGINFLQQDLPIQKNITFAVKYKGEERLQDKAILYSKETGAIGGKFKKGYIESQTRNLGNFEIVIDTLPPKIKGPWVKNSSVSCFVNDDLSGLSNYNIYIDEMWILTEYDAKFRLLKAEIPRNISAGKHNLKIIVSDEKNNSHTINKTITIK